jgi:hypothetical protein
VHLGGIGEGCEPDLADIRPGQPVLEQAADRIAVAGALVGVAHVEMGIERDQADLAERHAEAVRRGAGDRIVAAQQQAEVVPGGQRGNRVADRLEALGGRQPPNRHIACVVDTGLDLERLDQIVGADPLQRLAHRGGRETAGAPGSTEPASNRYTKQCQRGRPHRRSAGRRSRSSSSFALYG